MTKKKPTLAGDDDGRIVPAQRGNWIYSLIAFVSGVEREYNLPQGSEVPGSRSRPQS